MSSKREVDRLVDENRVLSQRLSDVEFELSRKEESLKSANQRKSELLTDLRDYQCKVKDLKQQLERTEESELEAKGLAHERQMALDAAETNLREKMSFSKSTINSLQLTINSLKAKLAEKEDKCDSLAAALQSKEELANTLTSDRTRADKDSSSRLANLNQALAQSKQMCAQLSAEVEAHKQTEWELAQKIEKLELANSKKSKLPPPTPISKREGRFPGTPARGGRSIESVGTPNASSSEDIDVDALCEENRKLKQDLSCLATNFELANQKSAKLRGEMKEMEGSMSELQNLFDKTLAEKEALQSELSATKDGLKSQAGFQQAEKEKMRGLSSEMEALRTDLDRLQQENFELQQKLKDGLSQGIVSQNVFTKLDSVKKNFAEEKLAMEGVMEGLRTELVALQEKCQSLEDVGSSYQESRKRDSGAIKALKSKVSKLTKEKTELCGQLEMASEKLEQAYDKIQLHKEEVKSLEVNLKAKEQENATLSSQQQRDQSRLPVEVEKLRAKVIETVEELEDLRSKNSCHKAVREKLEAKVADLTKANTKLSRESKHASDLAMKMNSEIERLEERIQEVSVSLEAKTRECGATQQKLDDAKAQLDRINSAKVNSESEMKDLLGRVSELEEKNFDLASQLANWQREAENALETRSNATSKVAELESKLDAAEFALLEKSSELSELKCAYELMEAENSTLLAQVTSLSEMVSTRNVKLEAHQAQSVRQESEVLEILERISELESNHAGCAGTIRKLKESNEEMKESLEANAVSQRKAEENIASLKADIRTLRESGEILKAQNGDLQDRIASQDARNEELKERHAASENRALKLEQDLKTEGIALKAARDDLVYAKRAQEQERSQLAEKIDSLESKHAALLIQCEEMHRENGELRSKVIELRAELKEQKLRSSSLKIQRDSLSEQYESLKESALSVLQSESTDQFHRYDRRGEENSEPSSTTGKELKGILKKPRSRKVLKPVQDTLH